MYGASKDRHVGRRLALEKEKGMKWRDNTAYLTMLEHLADAGNPEACFIAGLTLLFARHHTQRGLVCLDQAAAYVLGLLLYALKDGQDLAKRYISQVEADVGCDERSPDRRQTWSSRGIGSSSQRLSER